MTTVTPLDSVKFSISDFKHDKAALCDLKTHLDSLFPASDSTDAASLGDPDFDPDAPNEHTVTDDLDHKLLANPNLHNIPNTTKDKLTHYSKPFPTISSFSLSRIASHPFLPVGKRGSKVH